MNVTTATSRDTLAFLRRELDAADRAYQSCAMRDTSSLTPEQRMEADIAYRRAIKRKNAAEDAYWAAIDSITEAAP